MVAGKTINKDEFLSLMSKLEAANQDLSNRDKEVRPRKGVRRRKGGSRRMDIENKEKR